MRKKGIGKIISNKKLSSSVYEMILESTTKADIKPGQFLNIFLNNESKLLPRPISICEYYNDKNQYRLVYKLIGEGTKEMSLYKEGLLEFLGPLGNGFELDSKKRLKVIIGGGVGIPPLLELIKNLKGEKIALLGFTDEVYLVDDFKKYSNEVKVSTIDGSFGVKGNVIDLLNKYKNHFNDMEIFACGPEPMLKAVQSLCKENNIPLNISLEERMACGIGACLVCNCKIKSEGEEGYIYERVCKDGPVFSRDEVIFNELKG